MNNGSLISADVETIYPSQVEAILEKNTFNRPALPARVNEYANAMIRGEWKLNGEPLIFDQEGYLLNGQHRLLACRAAGMPLKTMVVRGVARDTFDTMDKGGKRSLADYLSLLGYKDTRSLGAAVTWFYKHQINRLSSTARPSNQQTAQILQDNPDLVAAIATVPHNGLLPQSLAGFLFYLFSKKDKELAKTFFARLDDGANLSKNHPVLMLREYLSKLKGEKGKTLLLQSYAVTVKAWNNLRSGKDVKHLRWAGETESLPEPI